MNSASEVPIGLSASEEGRAQLKQIGEMGEKVGRWFRWRNACLVNAIVAKLMLRRRGIPSKLFLGLAKDAQRNLKAHAWLTNGEYVITGGHHHTQYVVMTSFVDVPSGGWG